MRRLLSLCLSLPFLAFAIPSFASWSVNGAPACTATGSQVHPLMVSDGAGGAIIVWSDSRGASSDIYAQRVSSSGTMLWTTNGVAVCAATGEQSQPSIAADGAGGAVIAWTDVRTGEPNEDIYVQRVNAAGVVLWTTNGVPVCTATKEQNGSRIVSDVHGGAIVVWDDSRFGSLFKVFAQRVNATGTPQWPADGIQMTSAKAANPRAVTDGSGGAFVAWEDYRSLTGTSDVYAQHVDFNGNLVLVTDGFPICRQSGNERDISIISDGAGGAIMAWTDQRLGYIFAQWLNASGSPQWAPEGHPLASNGFWDGSAAHQAITLDIGGGIIATWDAQNPITNFDVRANRMDSSENLPWINPTTVCDAVNARTVPQITSDNLGGSIIAWQDYRANSGPLIYAQRLNSMGVAQWAANGISVCSVGNAQSYPAMISDGGNGAIIAWQDSRDVLTTDSDIYVQRVTSAGTIPTGVTGPTASASFAVGEAHPNPFSGSTSLDIITREQSSVHVTMMDVAGRRVRDLTLRDVPAGARTIDLDARDERGGRLPAGVYFCRVTVGNATLMRKLVIVK